MLLSAASALEKVEASFRLLLSVPPKSLHAAERQAAPLGFSAGRYRFFIYWTRATDAAHVVNALRQIRTFSSEDRRTHVPILAVPFMGEVGRSLCESAGIGWMDLSGNAHFEAEFLKIEVLGKPNLFKRPGRPANLFAPKSSRITRWFLLHPEREVSRSDLARETEMDEGFTSRIVRKLLEVELLVEGVSGVLKARDPDVLLDAWKEVYEFRRHHIMEGHIASRSSDDLMREISKALDGRKTGYALTGLGAAWLISRHATFRLVTFYLKENPKEDVLDALHFRQEPRGANTWLVVPNDEGVFMGQRKVAGIPCVSAVQTYLDLKAQPERAKEAAEELRKTGLPWSKHA